MPTGKTLPSSWGRTVVHRLEEVFREQASKLAIRHQADDTMTFGDMAKRVDRLYQALSDSDVRVGSPIGVHMRAAADWICSTLAIIKYGCIYVPLDSRQGEARLKAIISECQPTAVFVDENTVRTAMNLTPAANSKTINVSAVAGLANIRTPIRTKAGDQAAFYYTSGSTGTPKGIPLTNEGLCSHMEGMSNRLGLSSQDVMLQQTAFSFDFSLWQILIALTNAAAIVVVPDHLRRDAASIVDLMIKSNVTVTATTPSEYSSWLQYGASKLRGSAWHKIICGGELMPHGFLKDLWNLKKPDLTVEHVYGNCSTKM